MAHFGSVHAFGYNSAKSERIWMKPGALWAHCQGADPSRFWAHLRNSGSWRQAKYFCQVKNIQFHRFPVSQISRNLNTTCRSVSYDENFRNKILKFYHKGAFFQKMHNFFRKIFFNVSQFQAAVTPQWLQITKISLPKWPFTVFLVSISRVGINSKSFPWPIHSIQETSPNFPRCSMRVDYTADITQSQAANDHQLLSHVTLSLVKCRK